VKAVKKHACAPRVCEGRSQGRDGLVYGNLDVTQVRYPHLRNLSAFVPGPAAEVKLGMKKAKWLAAECGGAALTAIGEDVATFDEHGVLPGGVCPYDSAKKDSCFSELAARWPPGY
jgi:hypothetical protein